MNKVALFFCCISNYAIAQSDREMFHSRYSLAPINRHGETDALQAIEVNIRFPLLTRSNAMVGGVIGYETLWTNEYPIFGAQSVHGISTQWLFNRGLENGHALLVVASAGIYSDFHDVSGEDFRYTAGVRYKRKVHEKFSVSYGIAVSGQFFGLLLAPFIDFDWQLTDKLRLSGPLPLNTRLQYTLTPRAGISFSIKPDNATYRLSKTEYDSRYFQKKQWNVGLSFEYQLTKHWQVTVRSGYSLNRKFEIYEADQTGVLSILTFDLQGKKRTPAYQYMGNAFFAEAMLAWVISRN